MVSDSNTSVRWFEISRTRRYFLLPRESRLVPISDPVVEPLHEVSSLVRFGYYPDWHVAGTCSMTVMNIEYLFGYTTGVYKKLKDDLRFRRLYGWIQFLLVNKTNDQHALIHALEIPCPTNWKCARSVLHMAYVEFSFSRIVTSTNKSWLYKLVDVHAVYCTLHMLEFSFYRVVTSTNKSFLYKLVNVHIFVYILFIWKKNIAV